MALAIVTSERVNHALYGLLNAPSHVPCLAALAALAQSLNLTACPHHTLVDDEGSPYSEYILTFVDTILVMYRSLATEHISLVEGNQDDQLNDEIDQAAFGALTVTTSASRILILISHCHHHVLRALWFGLLYLSMAYQGTKRGVAINFLLDTAQEEWAIREERAKANGEPCWGMEAREKEVEEEWYRRARRVARLRKKYKMKGGIWLGTVWAEMKGMVEVRSSDMDGEPGSAPTAGGGPPREEMPVVTRTSPDRVDAGFGRGGGR